MQKITRSEAKAQFRNDTDGYGKPKKIMHKLDAIFDYVEALEAQNKRLNEALHRKSKWGMDMRNTAHKFNNKIQELTATLAEHKRLHNELNDILHQNTEKPANPSLCDLIAYVQHDLKK